MSTEQHFHLRQGLGYLRSEFHDIGFAEKIMGRPYRCFPDGDQRF